MPHPSDSFYESIILTEEEVREAIIEGKKKKYFREKNREYWIEKESEKPGKEVAKTL